MDNICSEGTHDQYMKSPSGEVLGRDFHMRNSECEIKITQRFLNWAAIKWQIGFVASLVYMIRYGGHHRNIDMYQIL